MCIISQFQYVHIHILVGGFFKEFIFHLAVKI